MTLPAKALCLGVVALALLFPVRGGGGKTGDALKDLAKARVQAAEEAYRSYLAEGQEQFHMRMELRYLWSKRILDAQLDLETQKNARIAAFRGHFERMAELEKTARKRAEVRRATKAQVAATDYYRKEAEYWLAKAQKESK
jgi:hypothetical protein